MANFIFTYFYFIITALKLIIELFFFSHLVNGKVKKMHYGFYLILFFALSFATQNNNLPAFNLITSIVLMIILGIFSFRSKAGTCILAAIVMAGIIQVSFGIFDSLEGILVPGFQQFASVTINRVIVVAKSLLSLSLSILCSYLLWKKNHINATKQTCFMLLSVVPVFLIVFTNAYLSRLIYGKALLLIDESIFVTANHLQALGLQFFCIAAFICIVLIFEKIQKDNNLKIKAALMKQELQFQQSYAAEAEYHYGDNTELSCQTNNHVIDRLINSKTYFAEKKDIEVRSSVKVPCPCPINDMDLSIIIANMIDNAINQCDQVGDKERKYVDISSKIQDTSYSLQCINGCTIVPLDSEKKTELSSIQTITEKYHGSINMEREEKRFCFNVELNISKPPQRLME